MKTDPQNKTFKFNPIDSDQQRKNVDKIIYPSQNLLDFINEAQPFTFEAESQEFNQWFFNGEFKQKDIFEIFYVSPYQKSCLLNYILISFFTSEAFLDLEEKKNQVFPDLIYIDTSNNFNILSLHGLLSENLFLRSSLNPNYKNQNYVEEIINNIFSHLHIYKVYDLKQFLFTLRMLPFLIEKNKKFKLVIIDSLNTFPAYHFSYFAKSIPNKGTNSKDKSEMATHFSCMDKKTMRQIMKLIEDARNIREIGFIVTRKEMFKVNEVVGFNYNEKRLHVNNRVFKIFTMQPFKDSTNPIFLMNFHSFDEGALNVIYNDMEILQALDSFNLQNYSVVDIIHNGNLCFSLKMQNKGSEILCYIINKSNFFFLKAYPCILTEI